MVFANVPGGITPRGRCPALSPPWACLSKHLCTRDILPGRQRAPAFRLAPQGCLSSRPHVAAAWLHRAARDSSVCSGLPSGLDAFWECGVCHQMPWCWRQSRCLVHWLLLQWDTGHLDIAINTLCRMRMIREVMASLLQTSPSTIHWVHASS